MDLNSRLCEVSTYTQSSGYSSSTTSSSLNYIDEDNLATSAGRKICLEGIDTNNNQSDKAEHRTKLIITITLVKFDEKVFFIS